MGKEGDLWDDSALINAFDHAISTYKKMHSSGKTKTKDSSAEESAEGVIEENGSNVEFATPETARDAEGKSNILATDVPGSGEASCMSMLEENHRAESQVEQPCLDSTNAQDIQSAHNGYAHGQGVDDYYQLVAQYYELEEKRLKILEQLNQYGYQYGAAASSSGVPYSNSQDYSLSAYQVSDPNVACSCCPCFIQCALAPCTSVPSCSLGGSCAGKPCNNYSVESDHKILPPCEDGKIHKMAKGAAERALSTIRTTISGDLNVNEEKERENSEPEQINGSETDLTAVLNAWYSAGFYTGNALHMATHTHIME
ncbi:Survival motor neuron [Sesbania bispinosa]|nr:Survival motor neuron [Sesbania bispinosa]